MKTTKLNSKIAGLINDRLLDEYTAFYTYQAAGNWCQSCGFKKAAEYFKKESDSELGHARKLMDYLTDWNIISVIPALPKPKTEFKGLMEVIELAYSIELDLYEKYKDTCSDVSEMDVAAYKFLIYFLEVQTSSVAEYSDMLNLCEGVKTDDKFQMLMLEDKLFG